LANQSVNQPTNQLINYLYPRCTCALLARSCAGRVKPTGSTPQGSLCASFPRCWITWCTAAARGCGWALAVHLWCGGPCDWLSLLFQPCVRALQALWPRLCPPVGEQGSVHTRALGPGADRSPEPSPLVNIWPREQWLLWWGGWLGLPAGCCCACMWDALHCSARRAKQAVPRLRQHWAEGACVWPHTFRARMPVTCSPKGVRTPHTWHTPTYTHLRAHTHTRTHVRTHTCKHTCARTHTHAHTHMCLHTRAHMQVDAN